ncbi:MAG: hypothetical protein AAF799_46660 [Myxococcota bacterium]
MACNNDATSLGDPVATGSTTAAETGSDGSTGPGASGPVDGSGSQGGEGSTSTTPPMDTSDSGSATSAGEDSSGSSGAPSDAAMIIFVNFDGVLLTPGADDATNDQASLAGMFEGQPAAPYGDGPKRDDVMDALAEDWAPFDVAVTDERPAEGDYAMVVVTPTNPFAPSAGVALSDCDDANPNNVGLVFASIDDGAPAVFTASSISRIAARGLGLDNVDLPGDMMNSTGIDDGEFIDTCAPLVGAGCLAQHETQCPPGEQNSFAEIQARFPL